MVIIIDDDDVPKRRRVGLIYDEKMCKHSDPDDKDHLENPDRIRTIWTRLHHSGLAQRCVVLDGKRANDSHIALVHSKEHTRFIKTISSTDSVTRSDAAAKLDSIYFNEGSSEASYLAAGSVIKAAEEVGKGKLDSAFAIVRPPGHHAEHDKAMGFCNYNNVAIAASFLLNKRPQFGISKILIVDWDVHHGNGTQRMFYNDPRVLVFSVHRHDSGGFYPGGNEGSYNMIGEGKGAGYNINVPWEGGGYGDADYLAVWDHILIPIAKEFNPDIIMISAGFDAASGDPLGGCCLSPYGYSVMLDQLIDIGRGQIVMALEGGYNFDSLASSVQACVEVLLQERRVIRPSKDLPLKSTELVIQAVREALSTYWPVLGGAKLPDKAISTYNLETRVAKLDDRRCRCSPSYFTSIMEKVKMNMSVKHYEALDRNIFRHYLNMPELGHSFRWVVALLKAYKVESRSFLFGGTLVPFECKELSVVLGLQYVGQLVDINMDVESPFVHRVFGGKLTKVKRSIIASKLMEYSKRNDTDSINDFSRLYTVFVFNTILLPRHNMTLPRFVYPYIDDLDVLGYFSWGKVVYNILVDSMREHIEGTSQYFNGCTVGLLAWVHERINSLGKATSVHTFPRFFRWSESEIPKDEMQARKKFEEITEEQIGSLCVIGEEERLLRPPSEQFSAPAFSLSSRVIVIDDDEHSGKDVLVVGEPEKKGQRKKKNVAMEKKCETSLKKKRKVAMEERS